MRGQVTSEYLLLVAIGIALIGVSLVALSSIRGAEETVFAREKARVAALDISSVGNEVCALGDGNSRAYSLESAWIRCSGNSVSVSISGASAEAEVSDCLVECDEGEYSGEIQIRNSRGKVTIGQA